MLMDKDISTLLREIKDISKLSEPRIAEQLGTSQPTVNRILNGQGDCKGRTFKAIAEMHARVVGASAISAVAEQRDSPPAT
jgi:transcriptional regulator with XRE-family HTH domain